MIRPQKQTFSYEVRPSQVADAVMAARHLVVGHESSIDGTVVRDLYFEPAYLIMSEGMFATLIKHPDSIDYINFHDNSGEWKFMGLPMAVVRETRSRQQPWIQVT